MCPPGNVGSIDALGGKWVGHADETLPTETN